MKNSHKKRGIRSGQKSRSSSDILLLLVLFSFIGIALYSIISSLFGDSSSVNFADLESSYVLTDNDLAALDNPTNYYLGSLNATITVEIYTDLECPYCKTLHDSLDTLSKEYDGVAKFTYNHFPLSSHQNARSAAIAAECAKMQGSYFAYIDLAYNSGSLSGNKLLNFAELLNLDMEKFKSCLVDSRIAKRVDDMKSTGLSKGVRGTPSVFVNGKQISSWSPSSIRLAIDKLV